VQAGETLASIARTYHTTPKAIAEANDLNDEMNNGAVQPESRLIIPIAPGKQTDTSAYARATVHYKIRKGDTVESVAENFGVPAKMVRSWNRLKGNSLAGRKVLYLHLPVTPSGERSGETQVASKHSSVKQAAAAHHPTGTQTASARAPSSGSSSEKPGGKPSAVVHHKVKPGETLYSIASSYNTTVTALKHDNRNIAALRPGMILIVHNPR
jgi:LysM repeat protein